MKRSLYLYPYYIRVHSQTAYHDCKLNLLLLNFLDCNFAAFFTSKSYSPFNQREAFAKPAVHRFSTS